MKLVIEYLPEEDTGHEFSTCFRILSLEGQQPLLTAADLKHQASNLARQEALDAKRKEQMRASVQRRRESPGISGKVIKRYLPSREALKSMGYESLDAYLRRTGIPSDKPKREGSEAAKARQKIIEDLHLDFSHLNLGAL